MSSILESYKEKLTTKNPPIWFYPKLLILLIHHLNKYGRPNKSNGYIYNTFTLIEKHHLDITKFLVLERQIELLELVAKHPKPKKKNKPSTNSIAISSIDLENIYTHIQSGKRLQVKDNRRLYNIQKKIIQGTINPSDYLTSDKATKIKEFYAQFATISANQYTNDDLKSLVEILGSGRKPNSKKQVRLYNLLLRISKGTHTKYNLDTNLLNKVLDFLELHPLQSKSQICNQDYVDLINFLQQSKRPKNRKNSRLYTLLRNIEQGTIQVPTQYASQISNLSEKNKPSTPARYTVSDFKALLEILQSGVIPNLNTQSRLRNLHYRIKKGDIKLVERAGTQLAQEIMNHM